MTAGPICDTKRKGCTIRVNPLLRVQVAHGVPHVANRVTNILHARNKNNIIRKRNSMAEDLRFVKQVLQQDNRLYKRGRREYVSTLR
jgi:hypothetical protein